MVQIIHVYILWVSVDGVICALQLLNLLFPLPPFWRFSIALLQFPHCTRILLAPYSETLPQCCQMLSNSYLVEGQVAYSSRTNGHILVPQSLGCDSPDSRQERPWACQRQWWDRSVPDQHESARSPRGESTYPHGTGSGAAAVRATSLQGSTDIPDLMTLPTAVRPTHERESLFSYSYSNRQSE